MKFNENRSKGSGDIERTLRSRSTLDHHLNKPGWTHIPNALHVYTKSQGHRPSDPKDNY